MIYLWLEHLKKMHTYETHEKFQSAIDRHDEKSKENIRTQHGFTVLIEADTPYWND